AAIVEQRVHRFLQHALFVADNHVRRVQFHQLLEPVIAVDDAAVKIVEIGCSEAAAIKRHQRTQLRWDHRKNVQNHPLRFVAGLAERFGYPQALRVLQLLLLGCLSAHLLAHLETESLGVDLLEQFLDAFRAHHRDELAGMLLIELALLLVGDHRALNQAGYFTRIDDHESFEIENALQLAERNIDEIADAARKTLEKPDVRAGARELDVAEAFAAHARQRHFDAALIADHAAVLHALVLAAEALPIRDRPENPGAEQAIPLGLESPVIDGLGLGNF